MIAIEIIHVVETVAKENYMSQSEINNLNRYFIHKLCTWETHRSIGAFMKVDGSAVTKSIKAVESDEKYHFTKIRIERILNDTIRNN